MTYNANQCLHAVVANNVVCCQIDHINASQMSLK